MKKILLSNDDGFHAPGLSALYHAVKDLAEVVVAAPDSQKSAVGHAITISDPIKVNPVTTPDGMSGYAIGGTPADSVKLAVLALMPDDPPDLVMSGINLGPNAGISIIYSGTVSAATEGTILGIPSIALSLNTFTNPNWETAAHVARTLVEKFKKESLPPDTLLNVNIPNCRIDELRGYEFATMGKSIFREVFHRRTDPRGNLYFWMDGDMELLPGQTGTDVQALEQNYVTMTPLAFDLTHHAMMEQLRGVWNKDAT
ncbi:MAG: 5'/3'-nucleotidase SurE [Kiritimatiellia bacterium]